MNLFLDSEMFLILVFSFFGQLFYPISEQFVGQVAWTNYIEWSKSTPQQISTGWWKNPIAKFPIYLEYYLENPIHHRLAFADLKLHGRSAESWKFWSFGFSLKSPSYIILHHLHQKVHLGSVSYGLQFPVFSNSR